MQYFENTRKHGKSSLWLWIFVFWITVIGWLVGQIVITGPLPTIIREIDPELANDFLQSSTEAIEAANPARLVFSMFGFLLSTLIGAVFSLLALNAKSGKKRGFAIMTGICITISFASLFLLFPMMNTPETTEVMNRILAISPFSYALVLLTFPAALVMLYVGQKFVLKRSILSLHTAFEKYRWLRMFVAIFVTWAVLGLGAATLHFTGLKSLNFVFDPSRFFIYGLVSLSLIPLQSATEEIVFRGYLNQAVENVTGQKWIAFILTSLLFMGMHLSNPEALSGAEAGILPIVMSGYFFFGFAACLLVWMDDGLESAIGVHAANNTFAAILVNYENSVLPTPSVFQIKTNPAMDSILTVISLGLIVLILFVLRRKPKPVSTPKHVVQIK
ncbi:CAAX prenyl protease-like protein [Litorimonas taeanensis]|uniref:CAAX prenyl protease-like protein n=1 Tax=Litorimonas taeanensis TaxID=568099 RepID=A0A420WK65_9PROT|nr:CPBP family intramembrane glutamic endopeptidase [Litorimonas taeanensis]RKQ71295.1 CAAX prenyl protease-like protein [Litorimonas taeanensis]